MHRKFRKTNRNAHKHGHHTQVKIILLRTTYVHWHTRIFWDRSVCPYGWMDGGGWMLTWWNDWQFSLILKASKYFHDFKDQSVPWIRIRIRQYFCHQVVLNVAWQSLDLSTPLPCYDPNAGSHTRTSTSFLSFTEETSVLEGVSSTGHESSQATFTINMILAVLQGGVVSPLVPSGPCHSLLEACPSIKLFSPFTSLVSEVNEYPAVFGERSYHVAGAIRLAVGCSVWCSGSWEDARLQWPAMGLRGRGGEEAMEDVQSESCTCAAILDCKSRYTWVEWDKLSKVPFLLEYRQWLVMG